MKPTEIKEVVLEVLPLRLGELVIQGIEW